MRRVTLLRHAQAEERRPSGADIDRPLTPKGVEEAASSARKLIQLDVLPQLILASPARRTRETARIAVRELSSAGAQPLLEFEPRIYNATLQELLGVLRGTRAEVQHVMLVGHNPGISDAARFVSGDESIALGTARFVSADLDILRWDALLR